MSGCAVCQALTLAHREARQCLRCASPPPSPPERGAPGRCICGARLKRAPEGYYCNNCGADFPDRRKAQR